MLSKMNTVIIDTNVFVAALRSQGGASRQILRLALTREIQPIFGNALWLEYEDLLGRDVWGNATNDAERRQVLGSLCQVSRWVTVYYGWRPNLPDEGDNHLIELAVAGGTDFIITHNLRDITRGELLMNVKIVSPADYLERLK
jgi:putative PIN family toxin of toxin-antitoxin system